MKQNQRFQCTTKTTTPVYLKFRFNYFITNSYTKLIGAISTFDLGGAEYIKEKQTRGGLCPHTPYQ
jgi:hypothetical protein